MFVLSATNSLSREVEAIAISCSLILVGTVIIVIILSILGFIFWRKQMLRSATTISSVHTSSADTGQQTSMFHYAHTDEVNSCRTLY